MTFSPNWIFCAQITLYSETPNWTSHSQTKISEYPKFKSAAHVLQLMEKQSVVKMNQIEIDWSVTPGNFTGDYIIRGLHI